jgi:DNA-binding transcriptional MerR regulator
MSDDGITKVLTINDIQTLLSQNPLAAEQLRRIVAERQREELKEELSTLRSRSDGVEPSPEITQGVLDLK